MSNFTVWPGIECYPSSNFRKYRNLFRGRVKKTTISFSSFRKGLDYFFYYPTEEGLGDHKHDVEATFFKIYVHQCKDCSVPHYALYAERVIAKAHGLQWYDNTLVTDEYTKFPMTSLVEEGKHASCTDKNHDGIYTPTFDVNRRINDAWGVRDIMRSGGLYSGGFQAWMAKVRRPEFRAFPPLPGDSPLREAHSVNGEYAPENAIYELRPFPRPEDVDQVKEPTLIHFIDDKGDEDWPDILEANSVRAVTRWMVCESRLFQRQGFA